MKIVIIGGTEHIGSRLVSRLRELGHEVITLPSPFVIDTIAGETLDNILKGAQAVIDVANLPSFEDNVVPWFLKTPVCHLLAAEKNAGVKYHIVLSVVDAGHLPQRGYAIARMAHQNLTTGMVTPHSILQSIQFFEFGDTPAPPPAIGDQVYISPGTLQLNVSDDVVDALTDITIGDPLKCLHLSAWTSLAIL